MKYLLILLILIIPKEDLKLKVSKICSLPAEIDESSGLIFENDDTFWTHNDGGNGAFLYCINSKGELLKKVSVSERNGDWEEMVVYKKTVYIGDFGNNLNSRKNLGILFFPFRDLKKSDRIEPQRIDFDYEDQNAFPPEENKRHFDCEAMVVHKDSIYLFTKNRTQPYDGDLHVYVLPAEAGKHSARYVNTLHPGGHTMMLWWVTGAATVGNDVYLLSTNKIFRFRNFLENPYGKYVSELINLNGFSQKEAIVYDGKKRFYFTDEKFGLTGGNLSYANITDIK